MTAALVLAALVAIGLVLVLLELLIDREEVAAGMVLFLVVANAALTGDMPSLFIADIQIKPTDLGYGLLAAAAMARYLRLRRFSPAQRALATIALSLLLSLVLGAMEAVPSAFNDFRSYLGFTSAALYFSTVPTDFRTRERVGRVWLWAGCAIGVVIAVRWAGRFGGVSLGVLDATYDATIRVLSGPETFLVAHIALITLLPGLEGGARRVWERRLGLVMLLIAVVLNRRTVWLTMVVILVALLVRNPAIGRRVAAAALLGVVVFAVAVPYLPGSTGEDRPAAQTVTSTGTFLWRVEGWVALLESGPQGPREVAIGQPFGRGYVREVGGRELVSTPHSYYLQTYLRGGLVGLGALLVAMWLGLAGTARREAGDGGLLSRNTLFLLLLSQGVWFLTWAPGAEQGIVLGLAAAHARAEWTRPRRVEGRSIEGRAHV